MNDDDGHIIEPGSIPKASRPWWDVLLPFNSPWREGRWQDACLWPDDVWAYDALPTPEPPGLTKAASMASWKPGTPPPTPTRVHHVAVPFCLTCLRKRHETLDAVRETLLGIDPRALWDSEHLITGEFDPAAHNGHRVVAVRVSQVRGKRLTPDMQHLLLELSPKMSKPVERFKVAPEPGNQALLAMLLYLGDSRIDPIDSVKAPGRTRRRGVGSGLAKGVGKQAKRWPTMAEAAYGKLAATVVKRRTLMKGAHAFQFAIEDGMNLLDAHLKAILPALVEREGGVDDRAPDNAVHDLVRAAAPDLVEVVNRRRMLGLGSKPAYRCRVRSPKYAGGLTAWLDWHLANVYLALMAHRGGEWEKARAALAAADDQERPVGEVLDELDITPSLRALIRGDVMILRSEFLTRTESELVVPDIPSLMQVLEAIEYPRRLLSNAKERRAWRERMLNLIAMDLQAVEVTHVNWEPVLERVAPLFGPVRRRGKKLAPALP